MSFPKTNNELLVNLGCGDRIHPAWLNYDLRAAVPGVVECDFLKGVPLKNSCAAAVYSAAVLEHVRRPDVPRFLGECSRLLQSGGVLRIAVPDFEAQARAYLNLVEKAAAGDTRAVEQLEWITLEMIDQVGRDKSGGAMAGYLAAKGSANKDFVLQRIGKEGKQLIDKLAGRRLTPNVDFTSYRTRLVRGGPIGVFLLKFLLKSQDIRKDLAALEVGRFRLFEGEVHQWVYDRSSLVRLLQDAGFEQLQAMPHGESRIPSWKDHHLEVDACGTIEKPDLVIVEGIKP